MGSSAQLLAQLLSQHMVHIGPVTLALPSAVVEIDR
jgi:hypothetical protein